MRDVPFGRAIIVVQLIAALTFVGYTLAKKDVRLPIVSGAPFELEVELADAKGLVPSKGPAVGVAGAPAGRVTKVRVVRGRALVTLRIDDDLEGKIFKDASAFVRPTSALQTLTVNIDPGTPSTGAMKRGDTIPIARTAGFVHIDELTGTLDADTQAQVQVLVRELAAGLDGREPELRAIVAELGRLTDGATPLAKALDERRELLRRLTDNLDVLFGTLGDRGAQLASAIELGNRTLAVTARRGPELEAATRRLAPTLAEAQRALAAARGLSEPLLPALDALMPAARDALPTARRLRRVVPPLSRFVDAAAPVARDGAKPARLLAAGLADQTELIDNDQNPALRELIGLVNLLEKNRDGVIQFARNVSGATSANRRAGTFGQFDIMNFEASPEGFGLGASATRSTGGEPSKLSRMLAEMLERTCRRSEPAACLLRFAAPGLPRAPIVTPTPQPGGSR